MIARLGLAAASVAGMLAAAMPVGAQEYFAGKTITFVVPADPGGSTDTYWRAVAPFFGKHVPGQPNVIIQNMAGGAANNGSNFVYEQARPDGLTLLTDPWNAMGVLTKAPGTRIDYSEMSLIGGFPDPVIHYAHRDVVEGGMKDATDIMKAERVLLSGSRPDSGTDMMGRLAFDLLGINTRYIPGYSTSPQRQSALMAREVDAAGIGYVAYKNTVKPAAGDEVVGLFLHNLQPRASVPDVMDFPSFYKKVKGEEPSGPKWEMLRTVYLATGVFFQSMWAPPGTPEEVVADLRTGFNALMEDQEFQAMTMKTLGMPIEFVGAEQGSKIVSELLDNPDPELVKNITEYIASGR